MLEQHDYPEKVINVIWACTLYPQDLQSHLGDIPQRHCGKKTNIPVAVLSEVLCFHQDGWDQDFKPESLMLSLVFDSLSCCRAIIILG